MANLFKLVDQTKLVRLSGAELLAPIVAAAASARDAAIDYRDEAEAHAGTASTKATEASTSAASALAASRRPYNGHETGALFEYLFDEGYGDTVYDVSGNGRDLSLALASSPNATRTRQGVEVRNGAIVTPSIPGVRAYMMLVRMPLSESTGAGFITAGGSAANAGWTASTLPATEQAASRISSGRGLNVPRGRVITSLTQVRQLCTGGWRVIVRVMDAAYTSAYSFGGRAAPATTTNRLGEGRIAYWKGWSGVPTEAEIAKQYAAVRSWAARKGIFLHPDDLEIKEDVVLQAGQSNSLGRALISNLTAAQQADRFDAVSIMNFWAGGASTALADFRQQNPHLLRMGVNQHGESPATQFGPEYGMALRRQTLASRTRGLTIGKSAIGATWLIPGSTPAAMGSAPSPAQTWHPGELASGSIFHSNFLWSWYALESALLNRGVGPVLRGVAWDQGEQEAMHEDYAALYADSLDLFISETRTYTGHPDLIFSIGRIRDRAGLPGVNVAAQTAVQNAQLAAAAADPARVKSHSTDDLTLRSEGGGTVFIHYDAASQIINGQRHSDNIFGPGL